MKWISVIVLGLVLCSTTQARIGESFDDCVKRYGSPVKDLDADAPLEKEYSFQKSGLDINAGFMDQKIQKIQFAKTDFSSLSETEIDLLLKANGGEKKWHEKIVFGGQMWATENEEIIAAYNPMLKILTLYTKGFIEKQKALKASNEKKNLQGF